MLCKAILGYWI